MYHPLLIVHSFFRWLVLISLLYALIRAIRGYAGRLVFTGADNAARHWTATIAHLQLTMGIILYIKSPVVSYFWHQADKRTGPGDAAFFGLVHPLLMVVSVIVLTIGSALARRQSTDQARFRTMLIWFSVALFLIFIAIPWSFHPLANRPYFRSF